MESRWQKLLPLARVMMVAGSLSAVACGGDDNAGTDAARTETITVFLGTYTRGWACPPPVENGEPCTSKGIYRAQFNPKTGELSQPVLAIESDNPSYLAISPNGKFLYAVNETGDFKGEKSGAVSAYTIDGSGGLKLINQLSSHGADPCHVSLTSSGNTVLVANYSGGNVASYRVGNDGSLSDASMLPDMGMHGPHMNQDAAHAHYIAEGPTPGLVYVADLGLDRVFLYDVDSSTSKLTPHASQPFIDVMPAGSGPRHIAIHPTKKFLYTNNELGTSASAFARDVSNGSITAPALQNLSTIPLPSSSERANNGELQISPNGRFLYVSNRGHDSLSTFSVNESTGKLAMVENVKSGGREPRDFKIAPGGKFILAAHQRSDEIVTFAIDESSGKLTRPNVPVIKLSKPVNFVFWSGAK